MTALALAAVGAGLLLALTWMGRRWLRHLEFTLGAEPTKSWLETLFTVRAISVDTVLLTLQRAQRGKAAEHPMGSNERRAWLDAIGFDPASTISSPTARQPRRDFPVRLGPKAGRPLTLALPVLIAPMGWGIGLTAEAKVALAQAAALAGTAVVSGEGPYLPEERAFSHRWVLQASRAGWAHQAPVVALADMVEIQLGQGSEGGVAIFKPLGDLEPRVAEAIQPWHTAHLHTAQGQDLALWIAEIRRVNPEIPVGVKLQATHHLEQDLAYLLDCGFDVITLDGREAGSAGSPAVLSDQLGIPTALAVARAHRWLLTQGLRPHVSLVASGGVRDGADVIKLMALGADAVAVGSVLLLAMTHGQVQRGFPLPPTAAVMAKAARKRRGAIDPGMAQDHLVRWFEAIREELDLLCAALGLNDLGELRAQHLVTERPDIARALGIPCILQASSGDPGLPSLTHSLERLVKEYGRLAEVLRQQYHLWTSSR